MKQITADTCSLEELQKLHLAPLTDAHYFHLCHFDRLNHTETLQLRFQLAVLHNLVSDDASYGMLPVGVKNSVFLLEGEGVVILAGLAVSD